MSKINEQESEQSSSYLTRASKADNDVFRVSRKKTTRWFGGAQRDWNSRILRASSLNYHKFLLLGYFKHQKGVISTTHKRKPVKIYEDRFEDFLDSYPRSTYKLNKIIAQFGKISSVTAQKNFCLISGRGRTYSRYLGFGRHNIRKLAALGVISGLIK